MTTPLFKVAVRDSTGESHVFKLQHEDIQTHEQALALVNQEVKDPKVVLIGLPQPDALLEVIK